MAMNERLNQLGQAARRLNEGSDQLNGLISAIDKALSRLMIGMDYVHPRPLSETMSLGRDGKRVIELAFLGYLRIQSEYHLCIKTVKILESKVNRDSLFTGVAEGVIGYDRIIKMLTVKDGNLLVEEKAIYSIEKFLVSRRLMYWQVYLHKTVLSAEMMLVKIIRRANELISNGEKVSAASDGLDFFLQNTGADNPISQHLDTFCRLDDHDVMATIKNWCHHPDKILATLCRYLVERKLLKVKLQAELFDEEFVYQRRKEACEVLGISEKEAGYFVFTGEASNTTYNPGDERINILFKDGTIKDISKVDNALINYESGLAYGEIKKYYICYMR